MALKGKVKTTAGITYKGTAYALGEFKTFSGGNAMGGSNKSRQGAGQPQRARGGQNTVSDVTIGREDDGTVDLKWLASIRNQCTMWVKRTPADDDGNPREAGSWTYSGVLNQVNLGDGDVESESDLDDFTLVMVCGSEIA